MNHLLQITLVGLLAFILGGVVTWLTQVMPRQERIDNASKQLLELETKASTASEVNKSGTAEMRLDPDALAHGIRIVRTDLEGN